jgi:hypothetical protein
MIFLLLVLLLAIAWGVADHYRDIVSGKPSPTPPAIRQDSPPPPERAVPPPPAQAGDGSGHDASAPLPDNAPDEPPELPLPPGSPGGDPAEENNRK